jgi:septal ring factor EnvC (AmiA/AmiB activator)
MFGSVRVIIMAVVFLGISGVGIYVMKLRSDNDILEANQIQLELSIESQKQVIAKQKQDFSKILQANKKMNTLVNNLQKDINALDKRFNKGARDFGKLANEKPKLVEKLVNRGSLRAGRCIEIAGGSPLTEKEINATKKSEINTECPSIANPNYVVY